MDSTTLVTLLVGTGLLASVSQLILAAAALIRQKANKIEISHKIDANTDLTKDIHSVTNGPLAAMGQNVINLAAQAETNAVAARVVSDAAKLQATTDAQASKDKI